MCTSIIYFNQSGKWPIIIGTNRDERLDRKSKFPGRHWEKYPNIIAGKDEEKNGSWLGINDFGLVAIMHNRKINSKNKSLSRGTMLLEILKCTSIEKSLEYLKFFEKNNYNDFNLLIADINKCYWIKHDSKLTKIQIYRISEGISILTDKDLNDNKDKKTNYYMKLFLSASKPNPSLNDWDSWKKILTTNNSNILDDNENICFIKEKINYGTRSSSLIALPNPLKTQETIFFQSTLSYPTMDNYKNVMI